MTGASPPESNGARLREWAKIVLPFVALAAGLGGGVQVGEGWGIEAGKEKRTALREKYDWASDALLVLAEAYDRERGCRDALDACRLECELGHEDFPAPAAGAPALPAVSAPPPANLSPKLLEKLPESAQRVLGIDSGGR